MNNLIEAVKKYQQDEKLSDNQLTKLLRIDRSTWSYIKSGKRNPGIKFLRAIAREIPKLNSLVYVEISDNTKHSATEKPQNKRGGVFRDWVIGFPHWFRKKLSGMFRDN